MRHAQGLGFVCRSTPIVLGAFALAAPALAQDRRVSELEAQLAEQQARIDRLEALVGRQSDLLNALQATNHPTPAAPSPLPPVATLRTSTSPVVTAAAASPSQVEPVREAPRLDLSGDVRIREEFNVSDEDARDRSRTVLRARLRGSYRITPHLAVGGQLTTGDPDDPNSTDVTLGSFADDLDVSLDQAWIRLQTGELTGWAGKFPLPFLRTDMVWDGDVSPQGVGGIYGVPLGGGARLDGRAVYFLVDEAPGGSDSDMLGAQTVLAAPLGASLKLTLAGAYYHYRLKSLVGADSGDLRSNLVSGGNYLSDFRLANAIASLAWSGLGERWPVTLTGDYVHNRGAAVSSDSGYNIELSAGRTAAKGDWRLFYNHSRVGVDAVFAAFSHDNLGIGTNYRLHGLSLDYVPADNVVLNATLYHYRPLDPIHAGANEPDDWLNRIRLSMLLNF